MERLFAKLETSNGVLSTAELLLAEERLRLAIEAADTGWWDVEEGHGKLSWSHHVRAMFGVSADAPVTMDDFYNGLHPDDRDRVAAFYAAAADPTRRALYDVEYRTIGKQDGVIRWVAAKGRVGVDGPLRHRLCQNEVVEISDNGDRPWNRLAELAWIRRNIFSSFTAWTPPRRWFCARSCGVRR